MQGAFSRDVFGVGHAFFDAVAGTITRWRWPFTFAPGIRDSFIHPSHHIRARHISRASGPPFSFYGTRGDRSRLIRALFARFVFLRSPVRPARRCPFFFDGRYRKVLPVYLFPFADLFVARGAPTLQPSVRPSVRACVCAIERSISRKIPQTVLGRTFRQ